MRTSAKKWPVAESLGRPAQTSALVRSAVSNHNPGSTKDHPKGGPEPIVAGDNSTTGPSGLPLRAALTGRP
jgi:hypothetical protein